jgi:hypothetical protein
MVPTLRLGLAGKVIAVTGALALCAIGPAAHAATGSLPTHTTGGVTFEIPAGVTKASGTVNGGHYSITRTTAQADQSLQCTVYADTPFEYYGGPYGGGEEGIASLECNEVVYSIETEAYLLLNGHEVAYGNNTTYSTTETTADAIYPLSAGTYQTEMDAYVTATYGAAAQFSGYWAGPSTYLP